MKRIANQDRKSLIRVAWDLPKGSPERLTLLKLASFDWYMAGIEEGGDYDSEEMRSAILKHLRASKPNQLKELEGDDLPTWAHEDLMRGKRIGYWSDGHVYAGKFEGKPYVLFDSPNMPFYLKR